jgi:hypothetical protein
MAESIPKFDNKWIPYYAGKVPPGKGWWELLPDGERQKAEAWIMHNADVWKKAFGEPISQEETDAGYIQVGFLKFADDARPA